MQNITLPEKIVIVLIIFLVLILGGGAYMLFSSPSKPAVQSELSPQALIDSVSKIAELPPEQPTIATVTDKEKLASFSFFSQAQIGDRVLIFNEAKKAYLYRPSTDKIVEVGPILIAEETETESVTVAPVISPEAEASVAASQSEPATITLLNGTRGKGVALAAEKELNNSELNIEVKAKGNSKRNYTQTEIAVTNELSLSTAEQIAKILNAEIIAFPEGEVTPKTDIVVFLGTDRL